MPTVTYAGFQIKSIKDGSLYRARVKRSDGAQFQVNGKSTEIWETPQSTDRDTAIGQAMYAINTGRIT
jgi:hypothetical protein